MVNATTKFRLMQRVLLLTLACSPLASLASELASAALPQVINYGVRSEKRIALTFDACSSIHQSQVDDKLVQVLIEHQVPATLFMGGKWVEDQPEAAKELAANPLFEIANHGFHHRHLTRLDRAAIKQELARAQEAIASITGVRPRYFRAPYGEYDSKLVKVAASLGMTTIQYDLASGDPDKRATAKRLSRYVIHNVKGGSIVVMHINQRGWHTAEALPTIIRDLREQGYTFVTVSELLNSPFEAAPLLLVRIDPALQELVESELVE